VRFHLAYPIFYPVLSEEYAIKIAKDWNAPTSGKGYVARFRVNREFLDKYEVHKVGGKAHREYWIPAEDLRNSTRRSSTLSK
jgi:hypothetical protein